MMLKPEWLVDSSDWPMLAVSKYLMSLHISGNSYDSHKFHGIFEMSYKMSCRIIS